MKTVMMTKNDEIVMKLLHYFITKKGYNPIVLHGAENEIWLENFENDYNIIRIVSNYIHNDEQLSFDLFKTKQIMKTIKKKTMSLHMKTLSIFVNIGDNVHELDSNHKFNNILCVNVKELNDLEKYDFVTNEFPDINKHEDFKEEGMELFVKVTDDINKKNKEDAVKAEDVFKKRTPFITYSLIAINIIIYVFMMLGYRDNIIWYGANVPDFIRQGDIYRLLSSVFIHANIMHLICNMYALYVIGPQLESYLGRAKYLLVYLISGITGNLLSMAFTTGASVGASGAIFGLFGALLYFGYHYRVYLGTVLKSQIIPLIALNLIIGFMVPGINNAAHIGGLIGGVLATVALGVKYKSTTFEKVNGIIVMLIYIAFLTYMGFVGI